MNTGQFVFLTTDTVTVALPVCDGVPLSVASTVRKYVTLLSVLRGRAIDITPVFGCT